MKRFRLVLALTLLLLVLGGGVLLLAPFAVPCGAQLKAARPTLDRVAPEQNAWTVYRAVLDDKGIIDKLASSPFEDLFDGSSFFEKRGFTAQEKAYLNDFTATFERLEQGAARPKAQCLPGLSGSQLKAMIRLIHLVLAQGLREHSEGKADAAGDSFLLAYQLASALAEPHTSLLQRMTQVRQRARCVQALFLWAGQAGGTRTCLRLIREMQGIEVDRPTWEEVLRWEQEWAEQTVEDRFPRDRFHQNVVSSFLRQYRNEFVAGVDHTGDSSMQKVKYWSKYPTSADWMAWDLVTTMSPSTLGPHQQFTEEAANAAALQAILAAIAWRAERGSYPATLKEAAAAVEIPVPTDPWTRKPVGYRLQDGKPLVWLTGPDGEDNGGRKEYDFDQDPNPLATFQARIEEHHKQADFLYPLGGVPTVPRR